MANYLIIFIDLKDKEFVKKIIADNGFPIELLYNINSDCYKVVTWIKDYNPSDFLKKYWDEEYWGEILPITVENICVMSKTRWFKTDIGHDYDLMILDKLPEMEDIKKIILKNRKDDPRFL